MLRTSGSSVDETCFKQAVVPGAAGSKACCTLGGSEGGEASSCHSPASPLGAPPCACLAPGLRMWGVRGLNGCFVLGFQGTSFLAFPEMIDRFGIGLSHSFWGGGGQSGLCHLLWPSLFSDDVGGGLLRLLRLLPLQVGSLSWPTGATEAGLGADHPQDAGDTVATNRQLVEQQGPTAPAFSSSLSLIWDAEGSPGPTFK